jgi:2-polyprenyl-3-methyl-5-hydroxy-6-metoxy-1,4-benzoquinol methylase
MDLSKRSYQKELLDRDDIPFGDIERNMQELNFINTWLGGHAITVGGLKQLLGPMRGRGVSPSADPQSSLTVSICEIGAGGGDNLAALSRYCQRKGIRVRLTGIDINPHCITVARKRFAGRDAHFLLSDYRRVSFGSEKPDIIFSSLFCHHFTDDELVSMLDWMKENSGMGFFINDLQRNIVAWHAIRLLTGWFSRSRLVKNDAPLSVLRGFTRSEWEGILRRAGMRNYSLRWKWAFRWLLIVRAGGISYIED